MLLRRHHDDAAVGLLRGDRGEVGRWVLRVAVAGHPQHRGVGADRGGVVGRDHALRQVGAEGGALPCQRQLPGEGEGPGALPRHLHRVVPRPALGAGDDVGHEQARTAAIRGADEPGGLDQPAPVGEVECQRELRRTGLGQQRSVDRGGEHDLVHRLRRAGGGVDDGDRVAEPLHQPVPLGAQARECVVARRVGCASAEQQVEGRLAVAPYPFEHRHVDRRRPVEDRHPYPVAVLAQVVLGDGAAVGRAVQVDLGVAQGRPDRVEVVRCDRGRVEPWVGVQRREACAGPGRQALVGARR